VPCVLAACRRPEIAGWGLCAVCSTRSGGGRSRFTKEFADPLVTSRAPGVHGYNSRPPTPRVREVFAFCRRSSAKDACPATVEIIIIVSIIPIKGIKGHTPTRKTHDVFSPCSCFLCYRCALYGVNGFPIRSIKKPMSDVIRHAPGSSVRQARPDGSLPPRPGGWHRATSRPTRMGAHLGLSTVACSQRNPKRVRCSK